MKKRITEEAYFERINELAHSKKVLSKESKRNLGTLIDYKRAADGIAYGIVKENHLYYVKKGGLKQDPNVSDFAYIGGLENLKEFQYRSLAEADKQRNLLFTTISEGLSLKPNKTGSKMILKEDKAGEEIAKAEDKVADLDVATDVATTPEIPTPPIPDTPDALAPETGDVSAPETGDVSAPETGDVPAPETGDVPAPETGDVPAPEGGDAPAPETGDVPAPEEEKTDEIKEFIGKAGEKIMKADLSEEAIEGYIKEFLGYFRQKLATKFDPKQRRELADETIISVEAKKGDAEKDLEASNIVPDEETGVPMEEETCCECGGFGKYAECRGYTKESIQECDGEEMGNLVSGYANAYNDGQNDGDFKLVALLVNPEILKSLKDEYGHDDYVEKLTPYTNELSECSDGDKKAKINEFWGGLGGAFKKVGGDIAGAAQKGAQAVGGAVKGAAQAVGQKAQQVGQAVGQYATGVKQAYHTAEVPGEIKKLESVAMDLGKQIAALNTRLQKAGKQPVNVQSILTTIKNQLGGAAGAANLSKYGVATEGSIDAGSVNVQPNVLKEDDEPEEKDVETPEIDVENGAGENKKEISFAPPAASLGAGVVKPDGAPTTGVDITVQPDKTVNISMNEGKKTVEEKWDKDVEVKKTGEHAGKSVEQINAELDTIKKRNEARKEKGEKETQEDKEQRAELQFAKRAKQGWKENKEEKPVMSEAEAKLRKYIRARLEEKVGLKKSTLNESVKSDKLKKLDALIDEQFKLYEGVIKK